MHRIVCIRASLRHCLLQNLMRFQRILPVFWQHQPDPRTNSRCTDSLQTFPANPTEFRHPLSGLNSKQDCEDALRTRTGIRSDSTHPHEYAEALLRNYYPESDQIHTEQMPYLRRFPLQAPHRNRRRYFVPGIRLCVDALHNHSMHH